MEKLFYLLFVLVCFFSDRVVAQVSEGKASFYADKFEGRPTASGEKYRAAAFTAAHRTYSFGTKLRVINLENKKEVIVTVNDRGPFVKGRIVDLSKAAASHLDFVNEGITMVRIEVIVQGEGELYTDENGKVLNPKGWAIQLASFSQRSNAVQFVQKIGTKVQEPVFIEMKGVNNIPHYRILIGPYETKIAAEGTESELRPSFQNLLLRYLE